MERLVVKNSIDEAIIALQRTKQITIDQAIDANKKDKVSTKELLSIFGRVGKKDGKPFIFAAEDGKESRPPPRAADRESDEEGDGIVDDV